MIERLSEEIMYQNGPVSERRCAMRLLIAEDEEELAKGLKFLLKKQNFTVDTVSNGADALDYIRTTQYDGIILDIMMPKMDGLQVLRTIRSENNTTPVMMLTARAEVEDRVLGLESGADDYLPKPFATQEFIARAKALVRRSGAYTNADIRFGNIILDCNCYELSCADAEDIVVRLNNKEFQLAELFFRHPKFVFSSEHLMEKIWGRDSDAGIDVVWTYIGFLRKKLKRLHADIEIRTVRGAGYALENIIC